MQRLQRAIRLGLSTFRPKSFQILSQTRYISTSQAFRNQLDELSKNYEIKEKEETLVLPEGISESYFIRSNELKQLESMAFAQLLELFQISKSTEEFNQSKEFLRNWGKTNVISRENRALLIDLLTERNTELLFELLANRFKYSLFPTCEQLQKLMQVHAMNFMNTKKTDSLDMLYKTFALFLYYDIPPTTADYHYLIASGLYSGEEEAKRRSLMCLKEVQSLGWTLLPKTSVSLGYYYLQRKEYDLVLKTLEAIETKEALGLRIEALIHKKQETEAKALLAQLEAAENDTDFSSQNLLKSDKEITDLFQ